MQPGSICRRALRQIQLHDIAHLARRLDTGDWNALLAAAADDRGLWWAFPPLSLTARYYPGVIPANVAGRNAKTMSAPVEARDAATRADRRILVADTDSRLSRD